MKVLKRTVDLIFEEVNELSVAVEEYENISNSIKRRAYQGDGYKCGAYDGLPQRATKTAIERKIITIRERLNLLRKKLDQAGLVK